MTNNKRHQLDFISSNPHNLVEGEERRPTPGLTLISTVVLDEPQCVTNSEKTQSKSELNVPYESSFDSPTFDHSHEPANVNHTGVGSSTNSWLMTCINSENEQEEEIDTQLEKPKSRGRGRPRLKVKPTTSSERGKDLRKRRALAASKVVVEVGLLKSHVNELTEYRNILRQTIVRRNTMADGSFVKGAIQYLRIFERGCPKISLHRDALKIQAKQAQFLKSFMTPNIIKTDSGTGATVHGPASVFDQWNRYSITHATISADPGTVTVISTHPTPIVRVQTILRLKYSRATIEAFYRHLLWDNKLVQKLIGLNVEIDMDLKFYFNEQGYVYFFVVGLEFINGLVKALGNIDLAMALVDASIYRTRQRHMLPELEELSLNTTRNEVILSFDELASLKLPGLENDNINI